MTAGVAAIVQSNDKLLEFAADSFFLLFIGQLLLVVAISAAITRIPASARPRPVLRLRGVARA